MPNQTRLSMGAPKAEAEALFRPDGTGSQQQGEDRRAARQMIPPPIIRRTIPTTITNRLRLRPLVRFDSMPMPAPTAASGMISQFAQPRKGMKAGIANKSATRSEEHTSELQSLMRISYAVFCLKKNKKKQTTKESKEQH